MTVILSLMWDDTGSFVGQQSHEKALEFAAFSDRVGLWDIFRTHTIVYIGIEIYRY